jgi:hypothetical protein
MVLRDSIPDKFKDCISDSCRKQGCALDMAGIPEDNRVILDCDEYKARSSFDDRICDYIVLCCTDDYRVAVVEMKSGAPDHVRNAIDQIRSSIKIADEIIGAKPVKQFLPLLLHGGGISSQELKVLKSSRVIFRGKKYLVDQKKCGSSLQDIFSS